MPLSAASGWHALTIQPVSDRLQGEALASHEADALLEFAADLYSPAELDSLSAQPRLQTMSPAQTACRLSLRRGC